MAIEKIILENFTVFQKLELEFSGGVNIFIGENGTGKTHLLKVLYSFCETEAEIKTFGSYYNENLILNFNCKNELRLFNDSSKKTFNIDFFKEKIRYAISFENIKVDETSFLLTASTSFQNSIKQKDNSVFIPVTEMLSHSEGFLNLNEKYKLPFDSTQVNIIVNAGLPETRKVSKTSKKIMDTISKIIDGEVVFENDTYYIIKKDGRRVIFSLEAEGLRKFALLWQLLKNGSIDKGTILFWDEPEANINPKLIPVLVEILLELEKNGVQIFIATHDYILAKYFEIKRNDKNKVAFHSLFKIDNGVKCESNINFRDLKENPIIKAFDLLLDDVFDKNMGD